ncbi:MAG: AAA family ATPase [Defluviicoccus sp.]|nr:AAA family ATPase [Defluviicoccus sp.]MDE0384770.1 AAA family ATPase [Defluviicoccus sp.]
MVDRIRAKNIGPVAEADIRFGDLTIFVGPQATGKSIFLQLLKLLVDRHSIHWTMRRFGLAQSGDPDGFFDLYFGEGMSSIWSKTKSRLVLGEARKETDLVTYARRSRAIGAEKMFYIPAQRVMSLRDGMTRPFSEYRAGDPFVLRDFSDKLHWIVQNEIGLDEDVFPRRNRLSAVLRRPLEDHIFGGFELRTDTSAHQRRLVLKSGKNHPLPYLVWSAGQREFVPLLLGLYWLLPPAKTPRRHDLEWVVIEEPESGLHPMGIGAVLALVMELRLRGYRVCLSTHSPHVLDIAWALRFFQENQGQQGDVRKLLDLSSTPKTRRLADSVLKSEFKTYYFARGGRVHDISDLDPGSEDIAEGGWGGLTEFSGRVGDIVAEVVNRNDNS